MSLSPLHAIHLEAGARMVEFAGWQMPVQYTSIIAEHRAVRERAGLFDVSHMGEIAISGAQAEACCRRLFANDAAMLAPGRAHYSLITNEQGGVVDDIIVYRLASERFLVCVNAANTANDLRWIAERAPSGAVVDDVSAEYALLAIQGPQAAAIVAELAPGADLLARFALARLEVAGIDTLVARTGYTGEDGFELFTAASAAPALWRALLEAGGGRGLVAVGLGARDTLRLEAALPLYGHEIDDTTSPYESRLGWVVKLNRPDMLGYDALVGAKAAKLGHCLAGLKVSGGIAREGCAVVASGRRVGVVTSGSHCPTVGGAVALARLERDCMGAELAVEVRGKLRSACVTDLPFYVRQAAGN